MENLNNYINNLIVSNTLPQEALSYLQANFEALGRYYRLQPSKIKIYQEKLWKRHQEPQRYYHNLSHLYNLCMLLEQFQVQQPFLVQLAIWYHDSIYNPLSKENEIHSAQLVQKEWQTYLPTQQQAQLQAYIWATAKHQPQTQEQDELLFLDLDLAILAADPSTYKVYCQAIQQEYTTVYTLEQYQTGRLQVLTTFLDRLHIYYNASFREMYESAARANLTRELDALKQSL